MVADSPYNVDKLLLTPLAGFFAGLCGSVVMLALFILFQSISGFNITTLLINLAKVVLSAKNDEAYLMLAGAITLGLMGGIFGLLYALCQHRIPKRGLIFVGLFYGLFLWVVGGLLGGLILGGTLRSLLHTKMFLIGNLVYGLCLSFVAVCIENLQKETFNPLPKD